VVRNYGMPLGVFVVTLKLEFQIDEPDLELIGTRGLGIVRETAATAALMYLNREVMPRKFRVGAAAEFGYTPRNKRYLRRKARAGRTPRDHVWTGTTSRLARKGKIVAKRGKRSFYQIDSLHAGYTRRRRPTEAGVFLRKELEYIPPKHARGMADAYERGATDALKTQLKVKRLKTQIK